MRTNLKKESDINRICAWNQWSYRWQTIQIIIRPKVLQYFSVFYKLNDLWSNFFLPLLNHQFLSRILNLHKYLYAIIIFPFLKSHFPPNLFQTTISSLFLHQKFRKNYLHALSSFPLLPFYLFPHPNSPLFSRIKVQLLLLRSTVISTFKSLMSALSPHLIWTITNIWHHCLLLPHWSRFPRYRLLLVLFRTLFQSLLLIVSHISND